LPDVLLSHVHQVLEVQRVLRESVG
jgi:hypothetical protein